MAEKTLMEKVAEIGEKIDTYTAEKEPVMEEKISGLGKKIEAVLKDVEEKLEEKSSKVGEKITKEWEEKIDNSNAEEVKLPPIPSEACETADYEDNADVAD